MRRRRTRGSPEELVNIAVEAVKAANELAPMKGVALGVVFALLLCVVFPACLNLILPSGGRIGAYPAQATGAPLVGLVRMVAGLFVTLARYAGVLGAFGCVVVSAKNLVTGWRNEPAPVFQLLVVVLAGIGLGTYLDTLLPALDSATIVATPMFELPALQPGAPLPPPRSLTEAVQQAPARALSSLMGSAGRDGGAPRAGQRMATSQSDGSSSGFAPAQTFSTGAVSPLFIAHAKELEREQLDRMNLRVAMEPRCEESVNHALAAQHPSGEDALSKAQAQERVADALRDGWRARCFVPKA